MAELQAMSVSKPKWLEIVVESYLTNPDAKKLLTELSVQSPNEQGCSLFGVIKFNDRIGWEITVRLNKPFFLLCTPVE